ncbi:unnamed protein product [Brachionus calyciflorus]|uniref:F-box domain-containing protein n=1 Tax=Brachionus calyciflorus TaxID=104777 RepID=A0A814CSK7_9BILA|nr:unnamed protein product [Brachionus calyciflorus]
MFGLRKRAKLIHEEQNDPKEIKNNFNNLPIEIYFLITDFLSIQEILNFRLLNSFFKNLIDNSKFIWNKVSIKIDFNTKVDLEKIIKFINEKKRFNKINLSCSNLLTKKQIKQYENLKVEYLNCRLNVKELNILSINVFKFFPNCSNLQIDSFINTSGPILSTKIQTNMDLIVFEKLIALDLTCLVYDNKNEKQYIWNNVYKENCLLNKSTKLFPNLNELKFRHYNDSIYKLFKKISKLINLKLIEFDNCKSIESIEYLDRKFKFFNNEKKLNINNYIFNSCSFLVVYYFLKNLSDLDKCTSLTLVVRDEMLSEDEIENEFFKKSLEIISKMTNLTHLETNIFQLQNDYVLKRHILQAKFYAQLVDLSFIDSLLTRSKFNMENFTQIFINNKIVFKNLKSVKLQFRTDCKLKYLPRMLFDYFYKNSPSLNFVEFRIKCNVCCCNKNSDLKYLCSFFKYDFDQFMSTSGYFCFKFNLKILNENEIKKIFT